MDRRSQIVLGYRQTADEGKEKRMDMNTENAWLNVRIGFQSLIVKGGSGEIKEAGCNCNEIVE